MSLSGHTHTKEEVQAEVEAGEVQCPALCHQPVLVQECLTLLEPAIVGISRGADSTRDGAGAFFIDGTLGDGGHTQAFLHAYPALRALGVEIDPSMLARARARLTPFGKRLRYVLGWSDVFFASAYASAPASPATGRIAAGAAGVPGAYPAPQAVLLDLGISFFHYRGAMRGFSFAEEHMLDMRLDPQASQTAADLLNRLPQARLAQLFFEGGEERYARRIAQAVCAQRRQAPFCSARAFAEVVARVVPPMRTARFGKRRGVLGVLPKLHPATKAFQALRIAVNRELERLPRLLTAAFTALAPGGRLAVISFHSREDRIVKVHFRHWAKRCSCPARVPICSCGGVARASLITKKPLVPSCVERAANAASRSATLRVIEKR